MRIIFEGKGCLVECVARGKEAIKKEEFYYDLVLLDLGLPDIDGLEVAKFLRSTCQNSLPIVVLTAHAPEENRPKLGPPRFCIVNKT